VAPFNLAHPVELQEFQQNASTIWHCVVLTVSTCVFLFAYVRKSEENHTSQKVTWRSLRIHWRDRRPAYCPDSPETPISSLSASMYIARTRTGTRLSTSQIGRCAIWDVVTCWIVTYWRLKWLVVNKLASRNTCSCSSLTYTHWAWRQPSRPPAFLKGKLTILVKIFRFMDWTFAVRREQFAEVGPK